MLFKLEKSFMYQILKMMCSVFSNIFLMSVCFLFILEIKYYQNWYYFHFFFFTNMII